mgnify:CR=1 FL=1
MVHGPVEHGGWCSLHRADCPTKRATHPPRQHCGRMHAHVRRPHDALQLQASRSHAPRQRGGRGPSHTRSQAWHCGWRLFQTQTHAASELLTPGDVSSDAVCYAGRMMKRSRPAPRSLASTHADGGCMRCWLSGMGRWEPVGTLSALRSYGGITHIV